MIPVSDLAKEALNNPVARRKIRIQVMADRPLVFTDEDTKSFQFTEQCSGDYDLVLGGVLPDGCAAVLSDSTGKLAGTQFQGARLYPEEGVEIAPDTYEWIPLGVYEVYNVQYQNDTVQLSARNNLQRLDRPLSGANLVYPITLKNAMLLICQYCGVMFDTDSFKNDDYIIEAAPEGELSCRDAVSYIAEIAGSFVRCDRQGRLEFAGFEDTSPVFGEANLDGNVDSADGGSFETLYTPVYDGGKFVENESAVSITSDILFSQTYDGTPITITGVSFDAGDTTYLYGTKRYCIALSDNPFLTHDIDSVLESIGRKVVGCSYVMGTASWAGNPCLQAGDIVEIATRDGGIFRTIVTKTVYKYNGIASLTAGGTAPSEMQYQSPQQKAYSRIKAGLAKKQEQINALDLAIKNAFAMLAGVWGGYIINGDDLGGEHQGRIYLSDHKDVTQAQKIWVYSLGGIGYFPNGLSGEPISAWTADGQIVASLITASMIRTGILQSLNGKSWINLDDGTFNLGDGSLVYDGESFEAVSAEQVASKDAEMYARIGTFETDTFTFNGVHFIDKRNGAIRGTILFQRYSDPSLSTTYILSRGPDGNQSFLRCDDGGLEIGSHNGYKFGLYASGLYFTDENGAWIGATGSPGTGQKPVFASGICIGYTY